MHFCNKQELKLKIAVLKLFMSECDCACCICARRLEASGPDAFLSLKLLRSIDFNRLAPTCSYSQQKQALEPQKYTMKILNNICSIATGKPLCLSHLRLVSDPGSNSEHMVEGLLSFWSCQSNCLGA